MGGCPLYYLAIGLHRFQRIDSPSRAGNRRSAVVQWTPYYGGIKTQCQLDHQVFGGGFDALTQIDANNQQQGDGFDLAHMMAYSSAFFAKACARAWVPRHWIPTYAHRASIPPYALHHHGVGDGAFVDNLGVLPLLQRQIKRLIVCINTAVSYASPYKDEHGHWKRRCAPQAFGRGCWGWCAPHVLRRLGMRGAKRRGQMGQSSSLSHIPFVIALSGVRAYRVDILWLYLSADHGCIVCHKRRDRIYPIRCFMISRITQPWVRMFFCRRHTVGVI